MAPPVRFTMPPWVLNLVLSVQLLPFENIREIPLLTLSHKVDFFLVAITSAHRVSESEALSCRSPYLVVHGDKVVLRQCPSFLPKVASAFLWNEDIANLLFLLPSVLHL